MPVWGPLCRPRSPASPGTHRLPNTLSSPSSSSLASHPLKPSQPLPSHLHTPVRISPACSLRPAFFAPLLQPLSADPSGRGSRLVPAYIPQQPLIKTRRGFHKAPWIHPALVCCVPHRPTPRPRRRAASPTPHPRSGAPLCRADLAQLHCGRSPPGLRVARSCPRERHACQSGTDRAHATQAAPPEALPWAPVGHRLLIFFGVWACLPKLKGVLASRPCSLHVGGRQAGVCTMPLQESRARGGCDPGTTPPGLKSELCDLGQVS